MPLASPLIWVALRPSLYAELFTPENDRLLRGLGVVIVQDEERDFSSQELAQRITGFDLVVTGWGTPPFTNEVLTAARDLKLIVHSAGSIKKTLPPAVFERGIAVSHAAVAIAPAVAEMTLLLILLSLRQVHRHDRHLKANELWAPRHFGLGEELTGKRVGVIGAGYTGTAVIKLLTALKVEVWVYDPYLPEERADMLAIRKASLEEVLTQCAIVTLQAPPTVETRHMIGPAELAQLQDGAIFINTARAALVDQAALLAELQTGRIHAALDVFAEEPLPLDSPFRNLENVILTPHIAGSTQQARWRQGRTVVEEIRRFLADEPLRYPVTVELLDTMA